MRKLLNKIKNKFYITISLIYAESEPKESDSRFIFYVVRGRYTWDELSEKLKKTPYGTRYVLNRFRSYSIFKHLWFLLSPFNVYDK